MKFNLFSKIKEPHIAMVLTVVLYLLLFVLKIEENKVSAYQDIISISDIELAGSSEFD